MSFGKRLSFVTAILEGCRPSQVQQGVCHLFINMQKSVFLALWQNYELCGCKILTIKNISLIDSDKLVRIAKFVDKRSMHAQLSTMIR